MHDPRLEALIEALRDRGADIGELEALQVELDALEAPPPLWDRLYSGAMAFARRQWTHAMGELRESTELASLLSRAAKGEALEPAESALVREQLADLVRALPAGLIAVAIEVVPVPGTSVATPWLLAKLGLMPSRWREAHLLDRLHAESARLRSAGQADVADRVDTLCAEIEAEADARAADTELLLHWDADGDGRWAVDERAAYDDAVACLRAAIPERGWSRSWYLMHRGHVFGPVRFEELRTVRTDLTLLVRLDGEPAWVELRALLRDGEPPPAGD